MTDQIAYQEYIQRRYNAFCKTVIRCAALDKILKLKRQWERQVSLDYLMTVSYTHLVRIYIEDRYVRAVKGGTGAAKTGGNYAASLKATFEAQSRGFEQVLWLDGRENKYVEEVGAMNMMFVLDGKIVTAQLEGNILPGITRKSVLQLARDKGIATEAVSYTHLARAASYARWSVPNISSSWTNPPPTARDITPLRCALKTWSNAWAAPAAPKSVPIPSSPWNARKEDPMEKELWKGNEAIAEAAIRAGCKYFFGYLITPQNEIPEYLSLHLPQVCLLYTSIRRKALPSASPWRTR